MPGINRPHPPVAFPPFAAQTNFARVSRAPGLHQQPRRAVYNVFIIIIRNTRARAREILAWNFGEIGFVRTYKRARERV